MLSEKITEKSRVKCQVLYYLKKHLIYPLMNKTESEVNGMTKKKERITIFHRAVAFMLVWAIVITSLPYIPAKAEELKEGIGIYNHILTGQTGLQTTYKVKFYYTEKIEVTPAQGDNPAVYRYEYKEFSLPEEYGLKDENGKLVYLESDGQIVLEQGQAVNFISSSNTTFQNFLINNEITRIVIDVVCEEMRDGAQYYGSTARLFVMAGIYT